jgi:hypothetical protein
MLLNLLCFQSYINFCNKSTEIEINGFFNLKKTLNFFLISNLNHIYMSCIVFLVVLINIDMFK